MKQAHLRLLAGAPAEETTPAEAAPDAPLVHLRITGRHGVFLLQRAEAAAEEAVVDTRAAGGIACTCRQSEPHPAHDCRHVALLRACGFLPDAA